LRIRGKEKVAIMHEEQTLEQVVQTLLGGRTDLVVLEAGCGSMSFFRYAAEAYRVGIDISPEQLEKNNLIQERILGDIETYPLDPARFDLIVCWDVLEHLPHPHKALENFARALKHGGVAVLVAPNVHSLRGLITKGTPHWVHVWYYRYVVGFKEAGTPGNPPFKSFHRFAMSPRAIERFAAERGLEVAHKRLLRVDHPEYDKYKILMTVWHGLNAIVKTVTFGFIGTESEQGFQIILRRPAPDGQSQIGKSRVQ
jgi:SAM-dependent methyltransferase